MLLNDLEAGIIARLTAMIPDLPVMPLPEFSHLNHKVGTILTHYAGSSYSKPMSTDPVFQDRRTKWEIIVVMRALRGSTGTHAALDAVRLAMTGWQLAGCGKTIPVEEEFGGENGGIWQYTLTVEIPVVNLEQEEAETLPLLARLTADYGTYGTEEIPEPSPEA